MRAEKAVKTKFMFVTGGVVSSLGKGLAAASIGALLGKRGLGVQPLHLHPHLKHDPGHSERFTSAKMTRKNNYTTGRIYQTVIQRERRGEYLGKTVQVIPHITDEIKAVIREAAGGAHILSVEVGGTVGGMQVLAFLEALGEV